MDSCLAVEKEVDLILSRFQGLDQHSQVVLANLIDQINDLKQELDNASPDHELTNVQQEMVKQFMVKIKETVFRYTQDHRDIHTVISRLSKTIDRNFTQDFSACSRETAFSSPEKMELINKVICKHYYRQGMHDVANTLAEEAGLTIEDHVKEPFTEVHHICDSLKKKDLEPLLTWAINNRDVLDANNSSLEFMIHRLKYIELLKMGVAYQNEAITYARAHFSRFVYAHERDIQMLMGMLLYIPNGVEHSPYSTYFTTGNEMWLEIYELFIKDACQLLGVCQNSPLMTCINAGCTAVPGLLNIKQIMIQRQVFWRGTEELPIEIDLGSDSRYHSMFACPILRQQSTKENPPMRLACGHVISKDALQKLSNRDKLKCPYCPVEQSPQDARQIFF